MKLDENGIMLLKHYIREQIEKGNYIYNCMGSFFKADYRITTYINRCKEFSVDDFVDIYYNKKSGSDIDSTISSSFNDPGILRDLVEKYGFVEIYNWLKENVWDKRSEYDFDYMNKKALSWEAYLVKTGSYHK